MYMYMPTTHPWKLVNRRTIIILLLPSAFIGDVVVDKKIIALNFDTGTTTTVPLKEFRNSHPDYKGHIHFTLLINS